MNPRYLFVTGKLAEPALRRVLEDLAPRAGFSYDVTVLPITVVALATVPWIARHLSLHGPFDKVFLPGSCGGDLNVLRESTRVEVYRGPEDLRDLPEFFNRPAPKNYGALDIAILAEINHVPRLTTAKTLAIARHYRDSGADLIDLGCDPGDAWHGIADLVRLLRDEGMRVSIDSFDPREVADAVRAGAELVLSVNSSNRDAARDWGCEVVAIPDVPATMRELDDTIEYLDQHRVRFRVDPVLEPIGFGFSASLGRYLDVRRRYPNAEMLMGVGNLTELTDADSAGINVMLLGFCQEIGIRSVLTTEVINWSRSSVRELDLARRLVFYACTQKVLPKRLEPNLIMLRDPKLRSHGKASLEEMAAAVKDRNIRLFAEEGIIHVVNDKMHLMGTDPFVLFEQMCEHEAIDPSHAFYLGYEMCKAVTALTLSKNYTQDQPLRWGFLTRPEVSHRSK